MYVIYIIEDYVQVNIVKKKEDLIKRIIGNYYGR